MDFPSFLTYVSIVLLCIIFNVLRRSLISPENLFFGIWAIQIFMFYVYMTIADGDKSISTYLAQIIIIVAGIFFSIGTYAAKAFAHKKNLINHYTINLVRLRSLLVGLILFSICGLYILFIIIGGKEIASSFSVENLTEMITNARYNHTSGLNVSSKFEFIINAITFVSIYLNALIAGQLFCFSVNRLDKILSIIPIVVAAVAGILGRGSRMGILIGLSLWLASYLSTLVYKSSISNISRKKIFFSLMILILTGLFISGFITFGRYGGMDSIDPVLLFKGLADLPASFFAFSIWMEGFELNFFNVRLGYHTFYRLFDLFDINYPGEVINVGFTTTNYFTVFSELILDFNVLGMCIVFIVFGLIAGFCYERIRSGNCMHIGVLSLIYSYIIMSQTFSIFSFNTSFVAVIIFSAFCFYNTSTRSVIKFEN